MAITDETLSSLFRKPGPDGVGIELTVQSGGQRLDVTELTIRLARLHLCRAYVIAVCEFDAWLIEGKRYEPAVTETMKALAIALRGGLAAEAAASLDRLVRELALLRLESGDYGAALRFDFLGGYHENPTRLAILAGGTALCLTILVGVFATVQIHQDHSAPECRAQAHEIQRHQLDMLKVFHRREGKLTPELLEMLKDINSAARIATNRCGSSLHGITVKLTIPPDFDFEFKFGGADDAFKR